MGRQPDRGARVCTATSGCARTIGLGVLARSDVGEGLRKVAVHIGVTHRPGACGHRLGPGGSLQSRYHRPVGSGRRSLSAKTELFR